MKRSIRIFGLLSSLALLVCAGGVAQAGPMGQLKQANTKLNGMANANASDAALKRFVNRILDYDTMAQNTLRTQWSGLSAAQKAEFKKLFRGIIEKNYIKGLRKNAKYTVKYKREAVSGSTAKVYTVVHSVRRGRPRETAVVYKMRRKGTRWVVYDMITDDVSMERNYRKSFSRIIKDKGFNVLLDKMRKKLGS